VGTREVSDNWRELGKQLCRDIGKECLCQKEHDCPFRKDLTFKQIKRRMRCLNFMTWDRFGDRIIDFLAKTKNANLSCNDDIKGMNNVLEAKAEKLGPREKPQRNWLRAAWQKVLKKRQQKT